MTEQATAETRDPGETLPRRLDGFRDLHRGETLVVCGCGRSLNSLEDPGHFVTVGVNDVGRLFDPTYLVILNGRAQFKNDRFRYVQESRARALFTQLNLRVPHPHLVRFKLGKRGSTDLFDPHTLPYTNNSPYVALCLAAHLGATRIGLIGVDFTDHHFFADTGHHSLAGSFPRIDREYVELARACEAAGIEVFNLSAQSRLTAFPKVTPAELAAMAPRPSRSTGRKLFLVKHNRAGGAALARSLERAARALGVEHQVASWGDRRLPKKVEALAPDLLLVLGGRELARKWQDRFAAYNSAAWLFDDGDRAGVDSGAKGTFDAVFAGDGHAGDRVHVLPAWAAGAGRKGPAADLSRHLETILSIGLGLERPPPAAESAAAGPAPSRPREKPPTPLDAPFEGWLDHGGVLSRAADGQLVLDQRPRREPGGERGLASVEAYADVELCFELRLHPGVHFIAKLQQQDPLDQTTNSYHFVCRRTQAYVARHNLVLGKAEVPRGRWVSIGFRRAGDLIRLAVDGEPAVEVNDGLLEKGYCYLGTKGGRAELRDVSVSVPEADREPPGRRDGDTADPGERGEEPRREAAVVAASSAGGKAADPGDHGEEPHSRAAAVVVAASSVTGNGLKIGALVPTRGDRPKLLEHCLFQLRSQTRPPDEIVLVDDPPRGTAKDITWRYRLGVERARALGVDAIVICEDDDWYHPEYTEWLVAGWLRHGRPPLFGVAETWYFHLGIGKRKHLSHPGRASGFCTLISGACHPIRWPADRHPFVDLHLWRHLPGKTVTFGDKIRAIGVKHGIGMTGGAAHRPNFGWEQADGQPWFDRTVDASSRRFYSEIL